MSHNVMVASKMLQDIDRIDFVRIDGDRNDLPWQYTIDQFPALLVFPENRWVQDLKTKIGSIWRSDFLLLEFCLVNRKTESRIFSTNLQVNIQNVLGFLLANLDRPVRLHAMALICQNVQVSLRSKIIAASVFALIWNPLSTKKPSTHDDCFLVLRNEITDSISFSLKQWRKIPHHRGQIYRRLQILQRMYLQLFRVSGSCDFGEFIVSVGDVRRVWTLMWFDWFIQFFFCFDRNTRNGIMVPWFEEPKVK